MENDPTNIYAIQARICNLARDYDASLSPIGQKLCNLYSLTLKDFYEFSETLKEPHRTNLQELIRSKEGFCRDVINLNKKKK